LPNLPKPPKTDDSYGHKMQALTSFHPQKNTAVSPSKKQAGYGPQKTKASRYTFAAPTIPKAVFQAS